jgi:hypothetical protein
MPVFYPMQRHGRYSLGLGLTYELVHAYYGFDLGERYHLDPDYRIRTSMEIDRAVFETFGAIGLGYKDAFPRVSLEPFGHRFVPAMYGCPCHYAADADPWAEARPLSAEAIESLRPWTRERFEAAEPVRVILSQAAHARQARQSAPQPAEFNPHCRPMSALQNLGSVINTAFSVQGDGLFIDYLENPGLIRKFYANITELMLLSLRYFPELDGEPLKDVFVGNCCVSMISPESYTALNEPCDRTLMEYARSIGARFTIHQDSNVNPHLENYARLDYVHAIDFGQDTDFEKAARLFPGVDANCILFPSWIQVQPLEVIAEELRRLMRVGRGFRSMSFTCWEVDTQLGQEKVFGFHEVFRRCAEGA